MRTRHSSVCVQCDVSTFEILKCLQQICWSLCYLKGHSDVLGDTSKSHSTLFKGLKLFRVHERFSKVIKMKRKWKIYKQNRWNRNILQNANSFHVHWNGTRVPRKNFVHKKCLFSYFFQSHSSLKVENIFLIHDISNWVVEAVKFFRVWFNPFQPFFPITMDCQSADSRFSFIRCWKLCCFFFVFFQNYNTCKKTHLVVVRTYT